MKEPRIEETGLEGTVLERKGMDTTVYELAKMSIDNGEAVISAEFTSELTTPVFVMVIVGHEAVENAKQQLGLTQEKGDVN